MKERAAIRAVAFFEAFKGLLVVAAGSGLLLLIHENLHAFAAELIAHAHLNPASHYPRIFLDAVERLEDTRLRWLALGAAAYATLRFVEAWGLFHERAWAEVLAAGSGGVYLPMEVYAAARHPTWVHAVLLAVNVAVVWTMVRALLRRRRAAPPKPPRL